jgi:hypothetical protein
MRNVLVSLACLPMLLAASGAGRGGAAAPVLYPEWFLRTPAVQGTRLAVGYAAAYGDTSYSIREGIAHAQGALRVNRAVRIRSEYLQETLRDGNIAFRGELYVEDTLSSTVDSVVVSDTAWVGTMVLLLTGRAPVSVSRQRVPMPSRAPAWVTVLPKSENGMYAVGTARAAFDAHHAWKEAERQARRSLAFAARTSIRSATDVNTGASSNAAIIASTAADVRNIEIRERWADKHVVYVLVHARVTPIQEAR